MIFDLGLYMTIKWDMSKKRLKIANYKGYVMQFKVPYYICHK